MLNLSYVALVLLEGPQDPGKFKVVSQKGFGGSLKVGLKEVKSIGICVTYFQGPPETYLRTYF